MDLTYSQRSTHSFANLELQFYTQNRIILSLSNNRLIAKDYPSEILEGRLYLGD
jgi:hypothetical protein